MAEQGYPGIGTNAWQALFAPAATPKPIVDKLYASVAKVLSQPEVKDMLAKQMMTVALSASPEDFNALVQQETRAWARGRAREQGQDRLTARGPMATRTARLSPPRYDLAIEKDLEIPVRDGARLTADIFRPKSGGRFPVIVNIGAYQKDKLWVPPADLEEKRRIPT